METPATLNGYFTLIDDFFKKTFRDDSKLFLAIKTRQQAESFPGQALLFSNSSEATAHQPEPATSLSKPAARTPNFVSFSPRMILRRDGSALGKVKLWCGVNIPSTCHIEQGLALNSEGVVTAVGRVKELMKGLTCAGRVAVNTIAPASEDITAANVQYLRSDFYSSLGYQRNGLGSSNLLVDCGTTFFNLLVGAGFERQQLSYLEQREGEEQYDVMYAGVGFTGVNWSLAAKMTRSTEAWNTARLAVLQRLASSTAVACAYDFNLADSSAHVALGFTQGFYLRLPPFYRVLPAEMSAEGGDSSTVPLVLAGKAESSGLCSATIRGVFNRVLHWGLVAQKNMLLESTPVKYGLTLSMETDF